jgi:hypothetical protein
LVWKLSKRADEQPDMPMEIIPATRKLLNLIPLHGNCFLGVTALPLREGAAGRTIRP